VSELSLSTSLKAFDAVIFDMDGLLLDTERLALSAFLAACEQLGLGERVDVFLDCLGTNEALGLRVIERGFGGQVDHLVFRRVWDREYARVTSAAPVPLKEGAVSLLEEVARLCIPAAVATSTRTGSAREKLTGAGILERFEVVVGGDQVEHGKPSPDLYLLAAARLQARPTSCLALEDSANGVRAALAAGMTVVQIPDLVEPSEDLRALGHTVLRTLGEVARHAFVGGRA
jgi:HAD superfamily hydrolase (TIGR01509 family)